ncbi:Pentatricopeptide repeat-containing protein mitochondrial [Zea mays]|uniref:Pentatricopeptide repeat-containing protein mitochondrial n=1 Tax=Zea mays TaxID=4577 RepID=A0A1D6L3Y0_MAIZE|nr:Pentatricopeptide repeat-containing protein mitochondrial [Zea mays]
MRRRPGITGLQNVAATLELSEPVGTGRGEYGQGRDRCHEEAATWDGPITAREICLQA